MPGRNRAEDVIAARSWAGLCCTPVASAADSNRVAGRCGWSIVVGGRLSMPAGRDSFLALPWSSCGGRPRQRLATPAHLAKRTLGAAVAVAGAGGAGYHVVDEAVGFGFVGHEPAVAVLVGG